MNLALHTVSGGVIDFKEGNVKYFPRVHYTPYCDQRILAHVRPGSKGCILCNKLDKTFRQWQVSRDRIHSWIAPFNAVPDVLVSTAGQAVAGLDHNLAGLNLHRQVHLDSFGHWKSNGRSNPSSLRVDFRRQRPSRYSSRWTFNPRIDWTVTETSSVCHTAQGPLGLPSNPRKPDIGFAKAAYRSEASLRPATRFQSRHLLHIILASFYSDPLRGLTLGRSRLATCGMCPTMISSLCVPTLD